MANFLLEIGTEEIPARMITSAAEELTRRVRDLLAREHLAEAAVVESFSTPRRLAVLARGVAGAQPDISDQVLGPSLKVAFKDGQPTPAAHAFARKVNLELNALERISTAKGEYLAAKVLKKGREASALLAESLPKEVGSIYWPKTMYWPANPRSASCVRCAGSWPCSTVRWCRSSSAESRRETNRAATGFYRKAI